MKSTFLNLFSSRLALVSFVLAGFFLLAPDKAVGQAHFGTNYVSEATAKSRLEAESSALKSQIEILVPGTLAYKKAIWKYDLFQVVLNHLYDGKTVKAAVTEGYKIYSTDVYAEMSDSQKKLNRVELDEILS